MSVEVEEEEENDEERIKHASNNRMPASTMHGCTRSVRTFTRMNSVRILSLDTNPDRADI